MVSYLFAFLFSGKIEHPPFTNQQRFVHELHNTEETALNHLIAFKEKRGKEYPLCLRIWKENWDVVLNQLNILFADRKAS